MKHGILAMATVAFLGAPLLAQAQSVATPAGTDATGTTETGVESTGSRQMVMGASGPGVIGRGVGAQSANADVTAKTSDTAPSFSTSAGTDTGAAKAAAPGAKPHKRPWPAADETSDQ